MVRALFLPGWILIHTYHRILRLVQNDRWEADGVKFAE